MDCSTPGFPVHHQLLEPTQTHVHWVSDAIQPSSVIPFSSHLQLFPASGSFPTSCFFPSGGQSIGVSASASLLPVNIQDWFPLVLNMDWLDLLAVQGTLKSFPTPQVKSISSSVIRLLYSPTLTTGKTIALTGWTFVGKIMSLLFNMISRLVIAFLPRSKRQTWLSN